MDAFRFNQMRLMSNHTGLWSETAPLLMRSSMPQLPVRRPSKSLDVTMRSYARGLPTVVSASSNQPCVVLRRNGQFEQFVVRGIGDRR